MLKLNPAIWGAEVEDDKPIGIAVEASRPLADSDSHVVTVMMPASPAANPNSPEPDERDVIIAALQAQLANMQTAAPAAPAPRRAEPKPFPGEVYRERVDDTLLVFCAETYRDMAMFAAYAVDDDGRRQAKPLYSKSAGKALDPVYRAAVDGVHRLHEEVANG